MPKQYDAIKLALLGEGKDLKTAERIASATYNKHHPDDPVGPNYDKKKRKPKK